MKILDIPQSGKIGTMVSYKGPSGQLRRRYVIPYDPHTPSQMDRRLAFKAAARLWASLSQAQLTAWSNTTNGLRTHPRLGQSGALSPYMLFCRLNYNLAAIARPMVSDPPPLPCFGNMPVSEFTLTTTNELLALTLSVRGLPTEQVVLAGAKPCSRGTNYVDHFTILGLLPQPVGGVSDITRLYIAKFGEPPPGSRLFIQVVQQLDGWQSLPYRFTALVPNL